MTSTQYQPVYNEHKMQELILFISHRSQDDLGFSIPKLERLLYYIDVASYLRLPEPVTGATYLKYPHGPVPQELFQTMKNMQENGLVDTFQTWRLNAIKTRPVGRRPEDPSVLNPKERSIANEIITQFKTLDDRALSQRSQQEPGWQITQDLGTIIYNHAFLSADPTPAGPTGQVLSPHPHQGQTSHPEPDPEPPRNP